jgi:hypothetical protein
MAVDVGREYSTSTPPRPQTGFESGRISPKIRPLCVR